MIPTSSRLPSRAALLAFVLAGWLASGCGTLPGPAAPPAPVPAIDYWLKPLRAQGHNEPLTRSESLLVYFDYLRTLSTAELARENEQLKQAVASDKSDFTRLRYALLLSLPSAGAREHARALQLLEPIARDIKNAEPGLRALAALLVADLGERRRLEDGLQSASQRQKEEQARAADLQQKLDALKAIEKTLNERKSPAGAPARR